MKQFFDKDFWKNTAGCTVGTLIGILLTFGTSSYLENRNKTEMARKTVMLTLHNLDASPEICRRFWMNCNSTIRFSHGPLPLCPTGSARWGVTRCKCSSMHSAHAGC